MATTFDGRSSIHRPTLFPIFHNSPGFPSIFPSASSCDFPVACSSRILIGSNSRIIRYTSKRSEQTEISSKGDVKWRQRRVLVILSARNRSLRLTGCSPCSTCLNIHSFWLVFLSVFACDKKMNFNYKCTRRGSLVYILCCWIFSIILICVFTSLGQLLGFLLYLSLREF